MERSTAAEGRLHLLLLDPRFRLSDQPHHTRSADIARRLARAGHRVSVITTDAELTAKSMDAVSLDILGGASRPATVGRRFSRGLLFGIWGVREVDAVIAAACPAPALLLTMLFCLIRGIPFVMDERAVAPPPHPADAWFVHAGAGLGRRVRAFASRHAVQVFVSSEELKASLAERGLPREHLTVSPTGCDPAAWGGHDAAPGPWMTRTALLYAGPIDTGLETIVNVAAALRASGDHSIGIALVGDGPARGRIEMLAIQQGVLNQNLWLLPPMQRHDLPGLFAAASGIIVRAKHAGADEGAGYYDALAAGKPVVLLDTGPLADLVTGRGAGIALPQDPAIAARELRENFADGDGLRRAAAQAAALGAGRFTVDRVVGEIRSALEARVAALPRAVVMRRRMLATKRGIDVVISLAALIVLSPVLLIIAVAIMIKMGWSPVFSQERPGLQGRLFRIYKFRTMTAARDAEGALLPDEQRLTPLGKFLRRTSLDELPELFNVLKGDMSLVGPRPLLPEYLAHYTTEQRRRHDLRPGMSGWSQVNGRNALTWEEKFVLDVWYVDHLSLWLDLKILARTAWIALAGHGVSAPGHATMPRFDEIMARREGAEDV
ncbi:MAG: sugar transferase [Candidatus Binataceae bacterium]